MAFNSGYSGGGNDVGLGMGASNFNTVASAKPQTGVPPLSYYSQQPNTQASAGNWDSSGINNATDWQNAIKQMNVMGAPTLSNETGVLSQNLNPGVTAQQLANYRQATQYGLDKGYITNDTGNFVANAAKTIATNPAVLAAGGVAGAQALGFLGPGTGAETFGGGTGFSEAAGGSSGLGGASGTVGGSVAPGAALADAGGSVGATAGSAGIGAGNLGSASTGFSGIGNTIASALPQAAPAATSLIPGISNQALGGIGSALFGLYNSSQLHDIANSASNKANPLDAPQRQQAQQQLNAYLTGGQDITKQPAVASALAYADRQAKAKMAQMHLTNSGNAVQAATDYETEAFNKTAIPYLQTLAGIGGYNLGAGDSGDLLGKYSNAANNSVGYGLQDLFQGLTQGAPGAKTNTGGTLGGASQLASSDGPFGSITSRS